MKENINTRYVGQGTPLFSLYLKTALLSIITLGIYRFWGKTRLRKYVWSAARADDDAFEYTGTGLEKFLGFLVAIVVLAIYLGIVQMLLFYFGLTLFTEPRSPEQMLAQVAAIYITLFAVLPLVYFAQYRAQRYKMSRTRWRGLRFGMEKGAWGYVLRAIGYGFMALISFGLLMPLRTFRLEQYKTDRSWYGDAKFQQNGRWQALFRGMKHPIIGVVIVAVGGAIAAQSLAEPGFAAGIVFFVGYVWFMIGVVSYRVHAFNYMAGQKVLDGHVTFQAQAETAKVVNVIILGAILIGIIFAIVMAVLFGVLSSIGPSLATGVPGIGPMVVLFVLYVALFLVSGGLTLTLIIQPIIGHVVNSIEILNAPHLDNIRQRAADDGADAEGFADALDVGGAL